MRPLLTLCALSLTIASLPASAVVVDIYDFAVEKNGTQIFLDSFSDGAPPPSAPNFSNGTEAAYGVPGTFAANSESQGRLRINTADGALIATANGTINRTLSALLLTNTDPTNLVNGLKVVDTFSVSGLFDLVPQTGPRYSGYGLFMHDGGGASAPKRNEWDLQVQYSELAGQDIIRFSYQDFDAQTITTLAATMFAPPSAADAIGLTLERPNLNSSDLVASFRYFDDGVAIGGQTFDVFGSLFQDRNWVRGGFFASTTEVPEPASLTLVLLGLIATAAGMRRGRLR
jgi:hypothetical protein